jgi:hypothetical protein
MTKRLATILLLCFLCAFQGFAQTFGNEWINYSQSFYSIKIVNDGVYRIDSAALANAGIPVGSILSENFQLFAREKEIPIHIEDGGDSSIDGGDYILFFGQRNDGWLDSTIYLDPATIGNPGKSLYNDTIQYFLSWNNSTTNLRYNVETDVDFGSYTPASHCLSLSKSNYFGEYFEGEKFSELSSSYFVPGEGWGNGKANGAPSGYTASLPLPTPYSYSGPDAQNVEFMALAVSASNASPPPGGSFNHHHRLRLGSSLNVIMDTIFYGYKQIKTTALLPPSELGASSTLFYFDIVADLSVATDFQAIMYYQMKSEDSQFWCCFLLRFLASKQFDGIENPT